MTLILAGFLTLMQDDWKPCNWCGQTGEVKCTGARHELHLSAGFRCPGGDTCNLCKGRGWLPVYHAKQPQQQQSTPAPGRVPPSGGTGQDALGLTRQDYHQIGQAMVAAIAQMKANKIAAYKAEWRGDHENWVISERLRALKGFRSDISPLMTPIFLEQRLKVDEDPSWIDRMNATWRESQRRQFEAEKARLQTRERRPPLYDFGLHSTSAQRLEKMREDVAKLEKDRDRWREVLGRLGSQERELDSIAVDQEELKRRLRDEYMEEIRGSTDVFLAGVVRGTLNLRRSRVLSAEVTSALRDSVTVTGSTLTLVEEGIEPSQNIDRVAAAGELVNIIRSSPMTTEMAKSLGYISSCAHIADASRQTAELWNASWKGDSARVEQLRVQIVRSWSAADPSATVSTGVLLGISGEAVWTRYELFRAERHIAAQRDSLRDREAYAKETLRQIETHLMAKKTVLQAASEAKAREGD